MRPSRYNMIIPVSDEEYLFVNTFTGAIFSGSEEVLTILNGDLESCDREVLSTLVSSGFFTELPPKEETEAAFGKLESIRKQYEELSLFVFILTYNCNMRCDYCYQAYVFKKGESWLHQKMTVDHVDAAFEAIQALNPHTDTPINVVGGEPLMSSNYDLVKYVTEKGTALGKSFVIATNGLEADAFIPLLLETNVESLQITVDGVQEIHDKRKKKVDGKGSFQKIVKSIDRIVEAGIFVYIRINFDHSTVRALPDLMDFIEEKGWRNVKTLNYYLTPVTHHTAGGCFNFLCNVEEGDLEFIMADETLQRAFWRGLGVIRAKLGFQERWLPQITYCRNNPSQALFDPFGDIYLCTDSAGDTEHVVGTYYPELYFNEQYYQWKKRTIFDMKSCRHCKYAMICGGGCGHYTYHHKGGILKPDCTFSKQVKDYYSLIWKNIKKFEDRE